MNRYIFDLDGTLVVSSKSISEDRRDFLLEFMQYNYCYLATSSSIENVIIQLGQELVESFDYIFCNNGNYIYKKDSVVYVNDGINFDIAKLWLNSKIAKIPYPHKTAPFITESNSTLTVKIAGINMSAAQRENFIVWPTQQLIRSRLCKEFNERFPEYKAALAGDTSINISHKLNTKKQILQNFDTQDELFFFGDKIHPLGNDYDLAREILENNRGTVYTISKPQDTYDILTYLTLKV